MGQLFGDDNATVDDGMGEMVSIFRHGRHNRRQDYYCSGADITLYDEV